MAAMNTFQRSRGVWLLVLIPGLWLLVFFLVPCLIVLKISLSQTALAQPPYTPVFDWTEGWAGLTAFFAALSTGNYVALAADTIYLASYLKSLEVAALATLMLLLIGYPIAYGIARAGARAQAILILLVILPFWTSFLIRVYAWITILQHDGLLNRTLLGLGIIASPVAWLASDTAIYIGLVYSYLPFMVLPLYATLQKHDPALLEAAADLGARRWKAFWSVTLPLSWPGIAAGALLCFIPIVGKFVIPDLLGGSETMMIGQTLWLEFFANLGLADHSAIATLCVILGRIAWENLRARKAAPDMRRPFDIQRRSVALSHSLPADHDPGGIICSTRALIDARWCARWCRAVPAAGSGVARGPRVMAVGIIFVAASASTAAGHHPSPGARAHREVCRADRAFRHDLRARS
jgi:putrescine transport system permease protein